MVSGAAFRFLIDSAAFFQWGLILIFTYFFTTWLYAYVRREYYFSKFNVGPKPLLYPIRNIPDFNFKDERLMVQREIWGLSYFPMYKIGGGPTSCLNLIGPDEIESVVCSSKHMKKSDIYNILLKWLGTGLLLSSDEKWHNRRKILTPAFHFTILQKFLKVFNSETKKLVKLYEDLCGNKKSFELDVVNTITDFALFSITETSMGTKLDMNNKEHKEYKENIHKLGLLAVKRLVSPWLWIQWMYYSLVPDGYRESRLIKNLHHFTRTIINERSKNFEPFAIGDNDGSYLKKKTMALIDILLNVQRTNEAIDENGIQEEVDTFLFEGHDTTSMAICFTLMLLANNPDHQTAVYEEIQQILGDNNQNPTLEELNELKLLDRCIKESLRLYPSVHFISRVLTEDWVAPSGHKFVTGSIVNVHIYDLHRNPNVFENPKKFDPDRFLPENVQNRHPFAYLPFSAGPRNCIGQKYAILEMKAALCGILQKFMLEPVDTPESIILIPHMILKSKNGIKVRFVKRM